MNLPLCSGGQPVTLTVPLESFAGVPAEAITSYIWSIPQSWVVQGAAPLSNAYWTNVSANTGYSYYLRGRSIEVTPPVGGKNVTVYASFYNQFCYETVSYNNLITSMLGLERPYTFLREPEITVANVPAAVACGYRTPFTPTATASQSGATFTYSVPSGSGWAVGSSKGVVKVTPSGSGGTTLTVTATYTCTPGVTTTVTKAVNIGFVAEQGTPTITVLPTFCPGETKRIFAKQVPGATQYVWTGIDAPLTFTQTNPSDYFIDVTAPAGLLSSLVQTVRVTAISGYGCTDTYDEKPLKAGSNGGFLTSSASSTQYAQVCGGNAIGYFFGEDPDFGESYNFVWSLSGGCYFTDGYQPDIYATRVNVTGPATGTFRVHLAYTDPCGKPKSLSFQLMAATSIGGAPCSTTAGVRLAALYPNPANGTLTLVNMQGTVKLYNAQGRPVLHQQLPATGPALLDTRRLPNGLYYLTGQDATGNWTRQAVQVQH